MSKYLGKGLTTTSLVSKETDLQSSAILSVLISTGSTWKDLSSNALRDRTPADKSTWSIHPEPKCLHLLSLPA